MQSAERRRGRRDARARMAWHLVRCGRACRARGAMSLGRRGIKDSVRPNQGRLRARPLPSWQGSTGFEAATRSTATTAAELRSGRTPATAAGETPRGAGSRGTFARPSASATRRTTATLPSASGWRGPSTVERCGCRWSPAVAVQHRRSGDYWPERSRVLRGAPASNIARRAGAAELKFLHHLRQARLGTSNRKAAPESYAC